MKKLSKLVLKEKADFLNEQEMKMIVGSYGATGSCSAHASSCTESCTTQVGTAGTCGTYTFNGVSLCACYSG